LSGVTGAAQISEEVGFFLVPNFPLCAFAMALEPLRVANWVSGRTLYSWKLISEDGAAVCASDGIMVTPHAALSSIESLPVMLVCAGIDGSKYRNKKVFSWLRKLARKGAVLGSVSTGTYVLARAGLLDGHRCTVHWEEFENLSREFPNLRLTSNLFEIDRNRMTCPGGAASLDMMLDLIGRRHGPDLAARIADEYIQHSARDGDHPQRMPLEFRMRISDSRILKAISAMERNVEEPLTLQQLAEIAGLSLRHFHRRFSEQLGRSPLAFYRELRLERAHKMLMHGTRSILDVAFANGFYSGSHFTRSYQKQFGRSPQDDRSL
jgi:transcriptional regulator GlxA family with amidase domain